MFWIFSIFSSRFISSSISSSDMSSSLFFLGASAGPSESGATTRAPAPPTPPLPAPLGDCTLSEEASSEGAALGSKERLGGLRADDDEGMGSARGPSLGGAEEEQGEYEGDPWSFLGRPLPLFTVGGSSFEEARVWSAAEGSPRAPNLVGTTDVLLERLGGEEAALALLAGAQSYLRDLYGAPSSPCSDPVPPTPPLPAPLRSRERLGGLRADDEESETGSAGGRSLGGAEEEEEEDEGDSLSFLGRPGPLFDVGASSFEEARGCSATEGSP